MHFHLCLGETISEILFFFVELFQFIEEPSIHRLLLCTKPAIALLHDKARKMFGYLLFCQDEHIGRDLFVQLLFVLRTNDTETISVANIKRREVRFLRK